MIHRFRKGAARVVMLVIATVLLVGVGAPQSSVIAQANRNAVQVTGVNLEQSGQDGWLKATVTVSESAPRAQVHATVTLPDGKKNSVSETGWFANQVIFGIQTVGDGVYTVHVDDIQIPGFSFDSAGSAVLEASLTIGEEEPDPGHEPEPGPGDEPNGWHPPTTHEHGDAPPQWATDWSMENFGHGVIFGGDEQTPHEFMHKPAAFKGFATSMDGADLYFRVHAQSNPHGRSSQFHSYEIYARDTAGNVSFWQGWVDCGNPDTARFPRSQGDPGTRPGMLVVDQAAWDAGIRFEQWYCIGPSWSWDLGWTIGETSTIYQAGEQNTNVDDQSTWKTTGSFGLNRRIEAAWYGPNSQYVPNRGNPPKNVWFCATPMGEITNRNAGGPDGCAAGSIPQYIASTMNAVEFPDNAVQKQFPGTSNLELPN